MKLTNFEMRWVAAEFEAIFPGDDKGVPSIAKMDVPGFMSEVMWRISSQAAIGLRVAIWIAALAPFFLIGKLATFTSLPTADRERVMTALVTHKVYAIRSLVMFLKTIGALLYCADDAVRARMFARESKSGDRPVALRLKGRAA
jgi:hypothetical protein